MFFLIFMPSNLLLEYTVYWWRMLNSYKLVWWVKLLWCVWAVYQCVVVHIICYPLFKWSSCHESCDNKKYTLFKPGVSNLKPYPACWEKSSGLFANFENFMAIKISWVTVQAQLQVKSKILLLDVTKKYFDWKNNAKKNEVWYQCFVALIGGSNLYREHTSVSLFYF